MHRVLGFVMFWAGAGMLAGLFINSGFFTVLVSGILLLAGYQLFCGK